GSGFAAGDLVDPPEDPDAFDFPELELPPLRAPDDDGDRDPWLAPVDAVGCSVRVARASPADAGSVSRPSKPNCNTVWMSICASRSR
ncbi:MAG: hypothetical protein ABMB14_35290, partial [Myxococcota bacterium]